MAEGSSNPLASMPPWAWLVVILGGGGTIGGLQLGGNAPAPVAAEAAVCDDAEQRARDALAAWKGMLESYSLLLSELGECRSG